MVFTIQSILLFHLAYWYNFLHFTLNVSMDRFNHSRGTSPFIWCYLFVKEFSPILVLLSLIVKNVVCRHMITWLKLSKEGLVDLRFLITVGSFKFTWSKMDDLKNWPTIRDHVTKFTIWIRLKHLTLAYQGAR